VGEAGGVAPSYALISQYFPPERRARAISIYSMGIPVGLATGVLLGAAIAKALDWRAAFVVIGAAGYHHRPDLPAGWSRSPRASPSRRTERAIGAVFAILTRKPSFWLMAFASSMSSTAGLWPGVLGAVDPDRRPMAST
jgi:predicted MFS family arabinose efflux permease